MFFIYFFVFQISSFFFFDVFVTVIMNDPYSNSDMESIIEQKKSLEETPIILGEGKVLPFFFSLFIF